jgi:hypothetical protein
MTNDQWVGGEWQVACLLRDLTTRKSPLLALSHHSFTGGSSLKMRIAE